MNQIVTTVALSLAVLGGVVVHAQEVGKGEAPGPGKVERKNFRGERRMSEEGIMNLGGDQGAMIIRMLANPKILAEADISTEQAGKLQAALKEVEIKMIDLDAAIKKASLSQTEQMAKLLADTQSSPKELMATVEKIGNLRTEQAKLQIQRLVAIREHLTPDQIAKIRTAAHANLEKQRAEKERHGGEGVDAGREKNKAKEGVRENGGREGSKGGARPAIPAGWGE